MKRCLVLLPLLLTFGCGNDDSATPAPAENAPSTEALTYYKDVKAIIDARCANCHRPGDIGPFSLTTYEEVMAFKVPVQASIANGTMPPWQPDDACNTYAGNIDITDDEKADLMAWLEGESLEGDPADAPEAVAAPAPYETDIVVKLPEPYTPVLEPDDYRCQLIPWPADEKRFVTGLRVKPDQRAIVHHVIVFLIGPDQVEEFMAYDAAEEGPGYTCYGGPQGGGAGGFDNVDPARLLAALETLGLSLADVRSGNLTAAQLSALIEELGGGGTMGTAGFSTIGSWVPGNPERPLPAGTGIPVEPGSMMVVQMHYNTLSSAPVADQSSIEIATAPAVEREATNLAMVDLGWISNGLIGEPMTIPAGESKVEHSTLLTYDSFLVDRARQALGLPEGAPLVIHSANHHMHGLGRSQRTEIRHADGSNTCVLDIPDWDFNWQGSYALEDSVTLRPGDALWMGCSWDNSAANQPIIDGEVRAPADVSWGEGTTDEMCLGGLYVTGE
ncbi:MAG: hypothetical protein ACE366_13900 [Bradymonadia bacterium]